MRSSNSLYGSRSSAYVQKICDCVTFFLKAKADGYLDAENDYKEVKDPVKKPLKYWFMKSKLVWERYVKI